MPLSRSAASRRVAPGERKAGVLDAFIDLLREGHGPPTSEQLADRAGISMATLFRYFDTLEEMRQVAAVRTLERFPYLEIPDMGLGPLDARIERFAGMRVRLWEEVHRLARFQRSMAFQDEGASQMVARGRRVMVEQVRKHFDTELRALPRARRDDAVASIASLTSVESWEQFREGQGRSAAQTRRAWARAIAGILERA